MRGQKRYVLQIQWREWEPWQRVPGEYSTIEEARAAKQQRALPSLHRIAEAYTVTRYKAIKE